MAPGDTTVVEAKEMGQKTSARQRQVGCQFDTEKMYWPRAAQLREQSSFKAEISKRRDAIETLIARRSGAPASGAAHRGQAQGDSSVKAPTDWVILRNLP